MEIILSILCFLFIIFGLKCAYANGVNDGFMYSKEPWNPGYDKAKNILKEFGKI